MNPSYVIGEPVTGGAFYGRQKEMEGILCGQGKTVHVLGMRRIGKTSLLLKVAEQVPSLYLDFQAMVGQVSLFARQVPTDLKGIEYFEYGHSGQLREKLLQFFGKSP